MTTTKQEAKHTSGPKAKPHSGPARAFNDAVQAAQANANPRDAKTIRRLLAQRDEMLAALRTAASTLRTLSEHSAFSDDAPEFNEGGEGYEAMQIVRAAIARADYLAGREP